MEQTLRRLEINSFFATCLKNRLSVGILISGLMHVALFGAALGIISWEEHNALFQTVASQNNVPLLALNTIPIVPPKPWILAKKMKIIKTPIPVTPTVTPVPVPVSPVASRLPVWDSGMITGDDYPMDMRQQNKQGLVIAELLINIEGDVVSVNIIKGSLPEFNQVVLQKLKNAKFRPALDKFGKPMNCRVRVPINFQLN